MIEETNDQKSKNLFISLNFQQWLFGKKMLFKYLLFKYFSIWNCFEVLSGGQGSQLVHIMCDEKRILNDIALRNLPVV